METIKKGMANMCPNVSFKGKVKVKSIVDNNTKNNKKSSIFFSGGVDSLSSLLSILHEKPILITIWGSDIWEHDTEGWETAKSIVDNAKEKFNLSSAYIKSNFRYVIDETALNDRFQKLVNDSWWHGLEHGLALLGHVAPYAFSMKIKTHYIPATYTYMDKNVRCASYPTIDESVKFCNCSVIHEGFSKTRQNKVSHICNFFKDNEEKINIRSCYNERGSKLNCCRCEKCYRTIMAIIAEKQNPNDYGYKITDEEIKNIPKQLLRRKLLQEIIIARWERIQNKCLEDKHYFLSKKHLKWIVKIDFRKNFNKANKYVPFGDRIRIIARKVFGGKLYYYVSKAYRRMRSGNY